jgi:hypothetical protein
MRAFSHLRDVFILLALTFASVGLVFVFTLLMAIYYPSHALEAPKPSVPAPECKKVEDVLALVQTATHETAIAIPVPDAKLEVARQFYAASPPAGPEPEADHVFFVPVGPGAMLLFVSKGCVTQNAMIPPKFADQVKEAFVGRDA